jgi:Uma2 family endonuclease
MAANPKERWTVSQYLELERETGIRHQYLDGEVFAMAGAEPAHNDIFTNTITSIVTQLKSRPCKVHGPDMRIKTKSRLYTYPDISIVCGQRQFNTDKPRTLLNPTVLIEILLPSTEAYDRGDKFHHCRTIASLREYVLIASLRERIECFSRQADDSWRMNVIDTPEGVLTLDSINCQLAMMDVYADVETESS